MEAERKSKRKHNKLLQVTRTVEGQLKFLFLNVNELLKHGEKLVSDFWLGQD